MSLSGVKVCVFDAYGTLFDVHAPAARLRDRLGDGADRLSAIWRAKQLEYSWLRSLIGRHADFRQVTEEALDFAMAETNLGGPEERRRLLELYRTLDAYPDAGPALRSLRDRGFRTAILSNGSPEMLDDAIGSAGLGDLLDAALSVEAAGIYKPHPSVYRLATETFTVAPEAVCFVSSNGWDAAGAAAFGFQVAWLNRFGRTEERLPWKPRATISGLDQLTDLLTGAS